MAHPRRNESGYPRGPSQASTRAVDGSGPGDGDGLDSPRAGREDRGGEEEELDGRGGGEQLTPAEAFQGADVDQEPTRGEELEGARLEGPLEQEFIGRVPIPGDLAPPGGQENQGGAVRAFGLDDEAAEVLGVHILAFARIHPPRSLEEGEQLHRKPGLRPGGLLRDLLP